MVVPPGCRLKNFVRSYTLPRTATHASRSVFAAASSFILIQRTHGSCIGEFTEREFEDVQIRAGWWIEARSCLALGVRFIGSWQSPGNRGTLHDAFAPQSLFSLSMFGDDSRFRMFRGITIRKRESMITDRGSIVPMAGSKFPSVVIVEVVEENRYQVHRQSDGDGVATPFLLKCKCDSADIEADTSIGRAMT